MSDILKKLTGKNKTDYEQAALNLVNVPNVDLFKELVESDGFLFDFVKQNTAQRINSAVNESNYKNLLEFFKYYSPYYEEVIVSNLVKYADEDLTDLILEKFEQGTQEEKAYAAKYFEFIKDFAAYDCLVENSYANFEYLSRNCASTLSAWHDEASYNNALSKLASDDDFERLAGVKFLTAYGRQDAVADILKSMKTSAMSENIAGEIPYLMDLNNLLDNYYEDALITVNNIINGLGEILPLSVVFDYELYDVFERLISDCEKTQCAIVVLNAREKFDTLTENDEYLFDEDKDTKNEVKDIMRLLKSADKRLLDKSINAELREDSPFVFTALEFAKEELPVSELLKSNNQTLILKTAEVLKNLGHFDETARTVALLKVTDQNIKSIIRAL